MKALQLQHEHEVRLGPLRDVQAGQSPVLLQRADEDFIEAVLDELKTTAGRQKLQGTRAATRTKQQLLKLFQPVQRQHHLALMEAWCDTPGTPRIDPKRVDSAGLVVRRVRSGNRSEYLGWMRSKGRVRGWMPVARIGGAGRDPLGALRLARADTGVPDIDQALRGIALQNDDAWLNEHVVPMFMAPPDVCKAAGKTVFYGLVPTVSSELSEVSEAFDPEGSFGPESADFRGHLVQALNGGLQVFPMAGSAIDPDWYSAADLATTDKPAGVSNAHWNLLKPGGSERSRMQLFIRLLRQLDTEFNAFDGVGPAYDAVRRLLASVVLPLPLLPGETEARTTRADVFLRQAADALLKQEDGAARPLMPEHWPALGAPAARELRQALSAALTQRFSAINPAAGRFEDDAAQYVVSCFVRLKPEGACPARTVWSADSEPFVIAPWYEGSGAPPVKIRLPDASNRDLLKSLKPNVSFVLPKALQNMLSGDPKDLMDGKPGNGSFSIGWICSFSIPIITLCAFIVLSIFLSLFDIFLRWMAFIKICLPYPKKDD